jgi:hypothetical protein
LAAVSQGEKSQLQLINAVTGDKQQLGEYSANARQGVKAAILDETIALASIHNTPNTGLFEVIQVSTGKRLFATPFPHEGNLQEIAVIRNAEQYLLCIHQGDKQRQNLKYNFQVGYHDGLNNQLWTGTVHSFDRTTGVAMWPTPATFYRHSVWPTQPASSPALIFVRMANLNNRGGNQLISILALDKRTGRMIYQRDDLNGQTHGMDIRIDQATQQIKFQFPSNDGNNFGRLVLAYTDKPRAPEPPYQEQLSAGATPDPGGSSPGGLLRAIFGSGSRAP